MADLAIGSRIELNPPLVQGGMTYADVSEKISAITENKPPKQWYYLITISSLMTVMLFGCLGYLVMTGIGVIANAGVIVAVPPALRGALPSCVVPEVKVTVPVGVPEPTVTLTVAVIVSGPPAIPWLGTAVTVVAVCACFTTWLNGKELLGPLDESPE